MKRIILLSDGTGNTPNKVWRSNVWRVFQSLDRTGPEQHPIYDDGVGTSPFLLVRPGWRDVWLGLKGERDQSPIGGSQL